MPTMGVTVEGMGLRGGDHGPRVSDLVYKDTSANGMITLLMHLDFRHLFCKHQTITHVRLVSSDQKQLKVL